MTLTPEDVAHLARLARISLGPAEAAALARDAGAILEGFHVIEGARASAGELPAAAVLALREDEVAPASGEVRDGIVRAFPEREGDLCRVPRSAP